MRTRRKRAYRRGEPKRDRARKRRAIKRRLGLGRRTLGAIGAGHHNPSRYAGESLETRYDRELRRAGLRVPKRRALP